jgi:hypothetical protein
MKPKESRSFLLTASGNIVCVLWPRKVPRKRFSFSMFWIWNIFAGTNTFEHAEFKSEKFPLCRSTVFSQTAILSSLISQQFFSFVQRHGSMTTNDYVTQRDQFLLTSLPFNKRQVLLESFWVTLYVILCLLDVNNISCLQLWEGTDNSF